MSEAVAIVRVGACCSIGLDAGHTAASIRAGVMRKLESPFLDLRGEPIVLGHLREDLLPELPLALAWPPTTALEQRLVRLGARALAGVAVAGLPLPLYLALPGRGPSTELAAGAQTAEPRWVGPQLPAELARQVGVELATSQMLFHGSAGVFAALLAAREQLLGGRAELALVGGVDSYHDHDRLVALERSARLRTAGPQDARVPGEAAGFVLLATAQACRRHALTPIAWIANVALGPRPSPGARRTALADVCGSVLTGAGHHPPARLVMAGLTGESGSAREWGVAALRSREQLAPEHHLEHPVEFIGDAGAGLAPLMLTSAALWLRAGKREGPALVWAGSDDDPRGALLMYAER